MLGKCRVFAFTALSAVAYCQLALGQATPATILVIDVENQVLYRGDVSDVSKLATDPNITTASPPKNFEEAQAIGDIVAVNGRPARGMRLRDLRTFNTSRTGATPGTAIADVGSRFGITVDAYEILDSDGNAIGSIMVSGLDFGTPPPGAPSMQASANLVIVGGTGAFLGARGQAGHSATGARAASMAEDPARRRLLGGARLQAVLHVIPMFRPEIVVTSGGPAVTHSSDFTPVTASKPASAGEILSLFMTGLGPTRPGVDPGKPFPASPPAVVNSPVDVTVNGKSAEVTAAVGYPGSVDGYQVNFRVPTDTAKGTANIQVSAAWIAGSAVNIVIQ